MAIPTLGGTARRAAEKNLSGSHAVDFPPAAQICAVCPNDFSLLVFDNTPVSLGVPAYSGAEADFVYLSPEFWDDSNIFGLAEIRQPCRIPENFERRHSRGIQFGS